MTLLDWCMFNFEIFSLVRGIRSLYRYLWCDRTDPFGRRCQVLDALDHPDYSVDNTNSSGHFLQIDVEVHDKVFSETSKVLLWNSRQRKDLHLRYVFSTTAVGYNALARTAFDIIQPWLKHDFKVVSDKYFFEHS